MEKWKPLLDRWERFLEEPRPAWHRYGVVLALEGIMVGVSLRMEAHPSHVPMSFVYVAIAIFGAFYGGFGPAILGGVISALAIDFFYTEPLGQVLTDGASVALFVGVLALTLFLSFLASSLRVAFQQAKQDQRRAEESSRAREHTLAVVSHDLRQPLTMISLQMQLLARQGNSEAAEKTLRSVAQMQRLIEDLLDASRAEGGSFSLKLGRKDLGSLVTELVESFRGQADLRGVELETWIDEDASLEAEVDGMRIRQALSNIVENALKFTPVRGAVRVSLVRPDPAHVEVHVRDSGPGILKENLPRIFERNWQAKDTAYLGTGLGLFIARGIVQAHQGEISVESEVGHGTIFRVRLPVLRSPAMGATA